MSSPAWFFWCLEVDREGLQIGQSISRLCPRLLLPSRPGRVGSKGLLGEDVYFYHLKGVVALLAESQICTIWGQLCLRVQGLVIAVSSHFTLNCSWISLDKPWILPRAAELSGVSSALLSSCFLFGPSGIYLRSQSVRRVSFVFTGEICLMYGCTYTAVITFFRSRLTLWSLWREMGTFQVLSTLSTCLTSNLLTVCVYVSLWDVCEFLPSKWFTCVNHILLILHNRIIFAYVFHLSLLEKNTVCRYLT